MIKLLSMLSLLAVALPVSASTPAAEATMQRDARTKCRAASALRNAVAGPAVGFSDTSAMTVLLVRGTWRPAHMKGAKATMLCLYDRRKRTAETQEAIGWTAPR
jgi:hypothetical protein